MVLNDIMQRCPGCMRPLELPPQANGLPGALEFPPQQANGAPEYSSQQANGLAGTDYSAAVCASCGMPVQFLQPAPFLPLRTHLLQGRIGVGCVVEQNGDGITYLAFDQQGRRPVYVREFFPAAIALREQGYVTQSVMQGCEAVWQDCAQNFMELWRKLQRLRGLSALLPVTDVFEENGTIYAVYEYIESMTLREFLLRGKLGYISWDRARTLLMPILSTLGNLHQQGIIHRGISPNTLYFGSDGKVRIGGFSIWQARTAHGDLTAELAGGYAALEQYGLEDQQGAWTDIYAFGAVLYRSLIGSDPDNAVSRRHNDRVMVPASFAERIPAYVINALINAMQVFPEDRTRTVEQLRAELSASPALAARAANLPPILAKAENSRAPAPASAPSAGKKKAQKKKKSSGGVIALKTAMIIITAGLAVFTAVAGIFFRDTIVHIYISMTKEPEATTVYVPPTTGQTFVVPFLENRMFSEEFIAQYKDSLTFNVVEQADEFAPEGRILSQSIQAGTSVEVGSPIILIVSSGKPSVELPKVEGENIREARLQLEELGFVINTTEMTNDGSKKEGVIISVTPEPGQEYPKGTELFIKIWGPVPSEATED